MTRIFVLALLAIGALRAEECPTILRTPEEVKTFGEARVRAIRGWDKLITWALALQNQPYSIANPPDLTTYRPDAPALKDFVKNYGYFSIYHPILGTSTESERDIQVTNCLLQALGEQVLDRKELKFATEEVMAKVLAYRSLEKGTKVSISVSSATKHTYVVDEVINLWNGMPAFGLVPVRKNGVAPILLFRGTDLDLTSKKGWASVLSDLDTTGPGHSTFLRARSSIHNWLKRVQREHEPPRAIGFSLGGVFVLYTMIYEGNLLNTSQESVVFNPPGISREVLKKWESSLIKPPHTTYVNQGDVVSKIGYFLDNVWELKLRKPMDVIESHVTLISGQPSFSMRKVDVKEENAKRESS